MCYQLILSDVSHVHRVSVYSVPWQSCSGMMWIKPNMENLHCPLTPLRHIHHEPYLEGFWNRKNGNFGTSLFVVHRNSLNELLWPEALSHFLSILSSLRCQEENAASMWWPAAWKVCKAPAWGRNPHLWLDPTTLMVNHQQLRNTSLMISWDFKLPKAMKVGVRFFVVSHVKTPPLCNYSNLKTEKPVEVGKMMYNKTHVQK